MLRLTLLPFVLLFGSILFLLVSFYIYRKIKRGLHFTYNKGAEIANEQQQKWKDKEQFKKLPEIVQKGFTNVESIEKSSRTLPKEWSDLVNPLVQKAKEILDEIASDKKIENNKLTSMRTFFIHTLDALKQFVEKLNSDHKHMSVSETEKARQNINVIKADLLHHQQILHKKRKFDFDVLMDVIKARLKS